MTPRRTLTASSSAISTIPGVTRRLAQATPRPLVEQLVFDLSQLAKGRSGYTSAQTRDYLINAGAGLWRGLIPGRLREQFWDRQHRIRQLTILADSDAVPWELYPMDPGHDARVPRRAVPRDTGRLRASA